MATHSGEHASTFLRFLITRRKISSGHCTFPSARTVINFREWNFHETSRFSGDRITIRRWLVFRIYFNDHETNEWTVPRRSTNFLKKFERKCEYLFSLCRMIRRMFGKCSSLQSENERWQEFVECPFARQFSRLPFCIRVQYSCRYASDPILFYDHTFFFYRKSIRIFGAPRFKFVFKSDLIVIEFRTRFRE